GSMFEFLRNNAMDARSFIDRGAVPPFRRNQFGGSLGGPIKKDKLFAFGNYEGFRQVLAVSSLSVVPDNNARQGKLPDGTLVANLNTSMLPYMALWPVANGPNLTPPAGQPGSAQAFYNPRQSIHENFGTMRVDYNASSSDTLAFSYTIDDGNSVLPLANPLFASAGALRAQIASLQETHVFSPRTLNTATIGFSRAGFNFDSQPYVDFPSNLSFVTGLGPGGVVIGGGVTTTGAGTITAAGPNNAAGVWNRRNLFTFSDTIQTTRGMHQLSVGVWFQRLRDNENSASRQLGQATFASLTTFLQGTVQNFQVVPSANALGWRSTFGAWFIEDSIKLRRNLTMRLGLRHEFTDGWNEASGRAANYIPDSSNILITAPRVADDVFTTNNTKKMFSPRVAIAWDPFGNGKTSIRAGFGTYYSLIDNLAFLLNSLPPYNGSASFSNRQLSSIIPITPGVQPPANTVFAPQGVQGDARTPTVQEWNFTIEQQLASNMGLRISYVGSRGYNGLLSLDPNSIPAQLCASASGCLAGGTATASTSQSTVAQGAQYIPLGTRPNPNLSGGFFWYTQGNSSYNGLQIDVVRRFTHGLQFRGNYTWSKNLDMNSGLTGAQSNNQAQMVMDRGNTRRDWGPSALNVTHQSSISARYELPFGKGKMLLGNVTGIAGKLISGWQLSGIATMLSGFPFTPQIGANRSGNGDTRNPDRPNVNPAFTGPVVTGDPGKWYNPAAFSLPAFGTWGNLGRGVYNGPGLTNLDISLSKNTAITERVGLQFRAEAFNVLNHTNYGTPNAIVFSGASVSSSAGLITTMATTPRQIQLGLKLTF
ncbi:MAG: carboxypeptidase regulatory-like domain-containing protein, partial [Bryobacteraceae bacterium]